MLRLEELSLRLFLNQRFAHFANTIVRYPKHMLYAAARLFLHGRTAVWFRKVHGFQMAVVQVPVMEVMPICLPKLTVTLKPCLLTDM